ncbi:MAG: DUF481 domain-containing protein [Verrucomicrobiota bacterium]
MLRGFLPAYAFFATTVIYAVEDDTLPPSSVPQEPLPSWSPQPELDLDGYDWIELKSGEWLKGEIEYVYNDKLVFDSDVLDTLSIDWDDIKQIKSNRVMSMSLDDRQTVTGRISMEDGEIQVTDAEVQDQRFSYFGFNRDVPVAEESKMSVQPQEVVSILPTTEDGEPVRWTVKASIGANFQSGNTDETSISADGKIERRTADTRLSLSFLANYTENNGVTNTENFRADTFFDHTIDRDFFVRTISVEYFRDPFQNISTQLTIGAGVGYHIIDEPGLDWEVVGGPAYQITWFDNVAAGSSNTAETPALVVGTNVEYDITDDLTFIGGYQVVVTNSNSGLISTHFVSSLEYELTDIFDLKTSFIWDRVQEPTARSDGSVPLRDDFYLIFGLGVSY